MTVIERIVNILEDKNIDQKDVCAFADIKEQTFSGWKKHYRNVPEDKLILIAKFLKMPVYYLMTGETEEVATHNTKELGEQEEELLRIFKSLNIKGQAALISRAYELEEQNK